MILKEINYNLANGKTATDTKKVVQAVADINNPTPINFTNNDWKVYPKAKKFSGEDNLPLISKLRSGLIIISDNGTIQAYITDNDSDKTQHTYMYNKTITDKQQSITTTQNIIDKLKNSSTDSVIQTLSNTSSGFKEVYSESISLYDTDFVIK